VIAGKIFAGSVKEKSIIVKVEIKRCKIIKGK
jgi:hypothetical protein